MIAPAPAVYDLGKGAISISFWASASLNSCCRDLWMNPFHTRDTRYRTRHVVGTITMYYIISIITISFDTIVVDRFGVTGKALDCFKSYLTGRCQSIRLGDCLSSKADLKFGVPQGSVLGPLLFTLHTTPLSSMISGHAFPHHLCADDSQLYVYFASGDSAGGTEWFTIMFGLCPVMDVDQ